MSLPHNALVIVADGRKILFLRNKGDEGQINLRTEAHNEREGAKDHEIKSDGPGLTSQSAGYGRPAMDETDFHQLEEDRWAKEVADIINKRALSNDFDTLGVIAAPKTMGELRKHWHQEVQRRIVVELPREMTNRPINDIEQLLSGGGGPPE